MSFCHNSKVEKFLRGAMEETAKRSIEDMEQRISELESLVEANERQIKRLKRAPVLKDLPTSYPDAKLGDIVDEVTDIAVIAHKNDIWYQNRFIEAFKACYDIFSPNMRTYPCCNQCTTIPSNIIDVWYIEILRVAKGGGILVFLMGERFMDDRDCIKAMLFAQLLQSAYYCFSHLIAISVTEEGEGEPNENWKYSKVVSNLISTKTIIEDEWTDNGKIKFEIDYMLNTMKKITPAFGWDRETTWKTLFNKTLLDSVKRCNDLCEEINKLIAPFKVGDLWDHYAKSLDKKGKLLSEIEKKLAPLKTFNTNELISYANIKTIFINFSIYRKKWHSARNEAFVFDASLKHVVFGMKSPDSIETMGDIDTFVHNLFA